MHHPNMAVVNGKIFVVGFLRSVLFIADGRSYSMDPAVGTWEEEAPMPAGTERGASGVAAVDGKIYVAGGLNDGAVDDFSVYDTTSKTWEILDPIATIRDHMAAFSSNGYFFVVGGRRGSISSVEDHTDRYNPTTGEWTAMQPMPTARGGLAGAVSNGVFYAFGGEGNSNDPSGVFDNLEAYDIDSNTCKKMPT
jgi:N-acetylneuraminic acid mutarotase